MATEIKKCYICGKPSTFYSGYLKQNVCKKHLEKMLIRRIKGELISRGLNRSEGFALSDDGSIGYAMNAFIFKKTRGKGLEIGNNTLEDFAVEVFRYFARGIKPRIRINSNGRFNPTYLTSRGEIIAFFGSKGRGLKEAKPTGKDAYLLSFLEDMESRRPGAMISIVKIGERLGII